jgi:hypothetical protein
MLVIDISVNRQHYITSIGAQRIKPLKDVTDDTVCTYNVGRVFDGKIKRSLGEVKHRYGDGAEALAEKAIGIVKNHHSTSAQEEAYERLISIAVEDMANSKN